MTMQPVESSNIHSVGYDAATETMRVRFRSGKTYDYPGTKPDEHTRFMEAKSKGGHFSKVFRVRKCVPVPEPESH